MTVTVNVTETTITPAITDGSDIAAAVTNAPITATTTETTVSATVGSTPVSASVTNGSSVSAAVTTSTVTATVSSRGYDAYDVRTYGAVGDGVTDDTEAIQDAIDAAEAVGGSVYLPTGLYKLTSALVIDSALTMYGDGVSSVWGLLDEAESRVIMCEIPTKSPYLSGSVLLQTTAATDVIQITVAAESVNLRHFGIRFADAIRFSNTGHGIYCLPPVNAANTPKREFGIFDARWDSIFVWGQDGNHYAFKVVNPAYATFTHLRGFGGGGLELYSDCGMYSPGNCVVSHVYFALFAGGTSHGIYLHSVDALGGKMILNLFLRPQVNALNGPAAWSLTPLDEVNQYRWYADATVLKTMLVAPDFENYLVNCPDTISTNNSMDGFNMLGSQAGGASGTKLSNANITAEALLLNADNGSIIAGLYPDAAMIQSPDGNLWKIKVANDGTLSTVEA